MQKAKSSPSPAVADWDADADGDQPDAILAAKFDAQNPRRESKPTPTPAAATNAPDARSRFLKDIKSRPSLKPLVAAARTALADYRDHLEENDHLLDPVAGVDRLRAIIGRRTRERRRATSRNGGNCSRRSMMFVASLSTSNTWRKLMGFEDSVIVKMGLDRRGFEKGIKAARGALGVFKGALGALGINFGISSIKNFGSEIIRFANDIQRTSEALGVSTDFLQTWSHAVGQSGGNAETAHKALEKFTRSLAAGGKGGSDVEAELRKVADAMAKQPDPVKRAKIAFDAFGKSAGELIPLLSGGSKALDEFSRKAAKLSSEDIRAIDSGADAWERVKNRLKVMGGTTMAAPSRMADFLKNAKLSDFKGVRSAKGLVDALIKIDNRTRAAEDSATSKTEADRKAAIELTRRAEMEANAGKAYKDAAEARTKADIDALEPAEKLNALLDRRNKILSGLAFNGFAVIANQKKLSELPSLNAEIKELQRTVGPSGGKASPAIPNARSRALALNPALQATLDRQAQLQSMSARDRVLSLNPALQQAFAKKEGLGKTAVEETSKGVWKLVELAEGEGLNIKPQNGE